MFLFCFNLTYPRHSARLFLPAENTDAGANLICYV